MSKAYIHLHLYICYNMADIYGGLSTRYVFHTIDKLLSETTHRDEFGDIDLASITNGDNKITILDIGCGRGSWAYHLRAHYSHRNLNIMGFDIDEDAIKFSQSKGNYDNIGYHDVSSGEIPLGNKSVDITLAIGVMDDMAKQNGLEFLSELKRISHNAIVTVPNTLWKAKDIKNNGNWFLRSFGFNIPKNRRPTLLDHFMDPIVFGLSRYKTHFWAREHFCWYGGISNMPTIERNTMGKEKIVRND